MKRKDLLEFMKPRISEYHYDVLEVWSKDREKRFLIFDRNFKISPTILGEGYVIDGGFMEVIVVG